MQVKNQKNYLLLFMMDVNSLASKLCNMPITSRLYLNQSEIERQKIIMVINYSKTKSVDC